jgi:hypothetical protein
MSCPLVHGFLPIFLDGGDYGITAAPDTVTVATLRKPAAALRLSTIAAHTPALLAKA